MVAPGFPVGMKVDQEICYMMKGARGAGPISSTVSIGVALKMALL
jgi:hypothetical protein